MKTKEVILGNHFLPTQFPGTLVFSQNRLSFSKRINASPFIILFLLR